MRRMLNGPRRYVSDWQLPRQAHGFFIRSDRAHAQIRGIDATAVLAMPGVIAVITGADVAAARLKPMPAAAPMKGRGGADQLPTERALQAAAAGNPRALVVSDLSRS
jgi:carbon-monoxide dehydrogenase large subunit